MLNVLSFKNISVKFYNITKKLEINKEVLDTSKFNEKTILLVVNYFGFPSNWNFINQIKNQTGCTIIEDNCHTLHSTYVNKELGSYGDISFNSLRKVLPVLSGSVVTSNNNKYIFPKNKSKIPKISQIMYSLRGFKKLSKNSNKNAFYANHTYSGIDVFSESIHSNYSFDLENIKTMRMNNFRFWEKFTNKRGLKKIINIENMNNVIPYAFPCISSNSAMLSKWIDWGFKNNIVIIRWPNSPNNTITKNNPLNNVLLFPVNHQYNLNSHVISYEF